MAEMREAVPVAIAVVFRRKMEISLVDLQSERTPLRLTI
jgi:hypothetical protein